MVATVIADRDYQIAGMDDLSRGFRQGHLRQCLVGATGSGKTPMIADMMSRVTQNGGRAMMVVDRVTLVEQASEDLWEYGLSHGIIQGDNTMGRLLPIQIASAQTLESRGVPDDCKLVLLDECHTQRQKIQNVLLQQGVFIVGLTATPFANGMANFYSRVVNFPPTDQLIEDGWLSPLRVYYGKQIDMASAQVNNQGEWLDSEVERRTLPVVGDVVSEWIRHTTRTFGKPVKTLVYTATVAAGTEVCRQYQAAGFRFEQISYLDKNDESRRRKIANFRRLDGDIIGLVSCEALVKGANFPYVQCIVGARPYRTSVMAHIQQLGRGMRIAPEIGKQFCLLLDHSGNYLRHAEATETYWAEGCIRLSDEDNERRKELALKKPPADRKCACGYVLERTAQACPMCGRQRQKRATRQPRQKAGEMVEHRTLTEEVGDLWPHVSAYAMEKKGKDPESALKMARGLFKDLTKAWPEWGRELEGAPKCDPRVRERIVKLQRQKYIVRTKMRGKGRG